jgi:hypothetical protein
MPSKQKNLGNIIEKIYLNNTDEKKKKSRVFPCPFYKFLHSTGLEYHPLARAKYPKKKKKSESSSKFFIIL